MEENFNIKKGDIVTVVGGGGKTSLIYYLSDILKERYSVGITTTTKIYFEKGKRDLNIDNLPEKIEVGSYLLYSKIVDGKIVGISDRDIERLKNKFDILLIEGDGSRGKGIKGWKEGEPVISKYTTKVIVVLDIGLIGKSILGNIHRESIYRDEYKDKGKRIVYSNFKRYIEKERFFKGYDGEKFLFFNKVENLKRFNYCWNIINELNYNSYMGSVQNREIYSFKKVVPIFLGAGFSKRFGEDKLRYRYREKNIMEYTLTSIKGLSFRKSYIIGRENNFKYLEDKGTIIYIENNLAHTGQSSSIVSALKNIESEGYLFILGDMPLLRKEIILKIIWEFQKYGENIISNIKGEKLSPPTIISSKYRDKFLELKGDTGGKTLLRLFPLREVFFKKREYFYDIDNKDDLKKWIKYIKNR